jgi:hypothetical protein
MADPIISSQSRIVTCGILNFSEMAENQRNFRVGNPRSARDFSKYPRAVENFARNLSNCVPEQPS